MPAMLILMIVGVIVLAGLSVAGFVFGLISHRPWLWVLSLLFLLFLLLACSLFLFMLSEML